MLVRIPEAMSIMEGIDIHALTNRPIPRAHHLAEASLVRKKMLLCPASTSMLLIGPDCENMNLKPSMEIKPGIA